MDTSVKLEDKAEQGGLVRDEKDKKQQHKSYTPR